MFGSSEGWSSAEIGGLSFTTTAGASCPNAGAGVFLCESSGACPVPASVCPTAIIALSNSHSNRQPIFRIFVMRSLGDDNGISRFQDDVLLDRFPLDQCPVMHGDPLLFAVFVAEKVNSLGVGKLCKPRTCKRLQHRHVWLQNDAAGLHDSTQDIDFLCGHVLDRHLPASV